MKNKTHTSIKGTRLHKRLSNKQFVVFGLIGVLTCIAVIFLYSPASFNMAGFRSSDLLKTIYWNVIGSHYNMMPTPTQAAPNAIGDRFFINAGNARGWSHVNSNDILKPERVNGVNTITLNTSLLGRTADLPIGTIIFLKEPQGKQAFVDSGGNIIEPAKGVHNAPNGVTSTMQVVGNGSAEIIIESILPHTTYISQNLGISFYYAPFIPIPGTAGGGQAFFVREIGNTIYLYDDLDVDHNKSDEEFLNTIGSHGKTVTVFYKDPQQSLPDAIKQKIFGGNIHSQCYITTDTHYGDPREDESYERAVIWVYPNHQDLSYQENENYILSCSKFVSLYGGTSYFMMDPKHQDRFLYISLGQDNIPSGYKGYVWDATIKIF